jgi:hypothetical protein
MPSQTSGDVRQNCVAVVEVDRERRAWKHLLDAAVNLKRQLFVVDAVRLDFPYFSCAISSSDKWSSLALPRGSGKTFRGAAVARPLKLNPNDTRRVAFLRGQRWLGRLTRSREGLRRRTRPGVRRTLKAVSDAVSAILLHCEPFISASPRIRG